MTTRNGLRLYPRRITIPHLYPTLASGAALLTVTSSVMVNNYYSHQSPAAINDSWKYDVTLEKGAWELWMKFFRTTASGIITFALLSEDTSKLHQTLGTIDLYGTNTANVDGSLFFTVTRDNQYVLTGSMSSKNASSSGYQAAIVLFELVRNGP